jgi:translocation and assembly module TamA
MAAPAPAQQAPGDDDLFAPLPPIPEMNEDAAQEPVRPIELQPVEPIDPALMAPLSPLATFDPAPRTDFIFKTTQEDGVRYRVTVEGLSETGLDPSFRRLSALYRGQSRPATAAQLASRANADKLLMERLLFSEGWYGATVEVASDFEAAGQAEIRLITLPGVRHSWRQIVLDLIPEDRPHLAEGFGLQVGDPIRAAAVEEAEGALLLKLNNSGYPFAEIGVRDVVLDAGSPSGTYLLTGQIGPQGVFGNIRLTGSRPFDEAHARVIARFAPGQPYDARLVDDFRRALIATQQFGGVIVKAVDTGARDAEGHAVAEMQVLGTRGPQRLLTGQIGYATEEGFRLEGSWRHRNFHPPEGMLTTRAVLGTEEQRTSIELLKSNFGQRDRSFELSAEVANLDPAAYSAQQFTLGAGIGRASTPIWQKRWTWHAALGLGVSRERGKGLAMIADQQEGRRDFLFASLPLWIGYDRSNNLLDPASGYRLRLEISPEMSREGTQIESYARTFLEGSAYGSLAGSTVLAGRARAGAIIGADLLSIAPTRRLYAGGGGSVRGYDYQSVGSLGVNGRPVGGRGLFESSVEVRHRFGEFGVVGFVDAGSVKMDVGPSFSDMRFGAGVGARYFTSFGPIRIDVARALNRSPLDPPFALYISIGQAF